MGHRIYVETTIRCALDDLWHATQDPDQHSRWDLRFSRITHLPTPAGQPQRFRYERRLPLPARLSLPALRRRRPGGVPDGADACAAAVTVHGTGISAGERSRPDGTRTSALRFVSDDRRSPIASGSGYWRYVPGADPRAGSADGGALRFLTGYDYVPGLQGAVLDRVLVRPLVGWATAWSFDRLRLWLEDGVSPEASARRAVLLAVTRSAALLLAVAAARGPRTWLALPVVAGALAPWPSGRIDVPRARRCRRRPPGRVRAPRVGALVDERALAAARAAPAGAAS